jgi:hypothetical protein
MQKSKVVLIDCVPLTHTSQPYLYNSTLISLQSFQLTLISLQLTCDLHGLYLMIFIYLNS